MLYKIQSEESDGTNLDAEAAALNNPPVLTSLAIGLTCAPLEDALAGFDEKCTPWSSLGK